MRNKRRTGLTVLSIGFSLFLLIALRTFLQIMYNPTTDADADSRLAVRRSTGLTQQMPISYRQKLEKMPHVKYVMPMQWFGGVYIEPKNFFSNFAVDQEVLWNMFPEYKATEETKKAFASDRRSAIAGVDLAKRYGWKVGDPITLKGTIFPVDLEFRLAGTFESDVQASSLYFRYDYYDEALGKPGNIGTFWIMADSPEAIPQLIETVDETFKNTPAETKTETEKAFRLAFTSMLGNLKLMIGSIGVAIVFVMLLVAASTMAMTIRERLREVAILKAIGYPSRIVLVLIIGEAVFVSLLGCAVGSACAMSLHFVNMYTLTRGFIQKFNVSPETYSIALAIAVGIGVFSCIAPALRASAMTINEAMRRLD